MTIGLILLSLETGFVVLAFVLAWRGEPGLGLVALLWGLFGMWAPSLVADGGEE